MTKKHLFQNGLALFVCLFMFAGALFAQSQTEVIQYTSGGQWEVPNDVQVTSVTFEAWGGGGAGGYAYSTNALIRATGGGGGGAYAKVTIDNPAAGDVYDITVGQGGHATGSYTETPDISDGGNSVVKKGTVDILKAVGGKTVTGYKNENGAMGGSSADCIGTVKYSGGNGADACPGLLGAWSTSGGGGGGAGKTANGGDGGTEVACAICLTRCTIYNVESVGAGGAGNPNGNGGVGKKTRIFSGDGWVNIQGGAGSTYGGGGGGSVSGHISAGDANGGQGGNGIVIVTYTYIDQTIEVADVEENLCTTPAAPSTNHTSYSLPLNVQVSGFQLKDAHPSINYSNITAQTGLDYSTPTISYNNSEGRWYIEGSFRNNNSNNTLTLTIPVTFLTENWMVWDDFTVTIHAYPRLDGGAIAKDQFVCADQTIEILRGDGSVVTDSDYGNLTTAEASGGSGSGTYQWYAMDYWEDYDYSPITGANANNYVPGNGYTYFKREFVDPVCGSAWAKNAYYNDDYLIVLTVNPLVLNETGFSEDTICSNENYTHELDFNGTSPAATEFDGIYLQTSTDKGSTWENVGYDQYVISLNPTDFEPGDDIWYRFAYLFGDCDPVPGNSIHKIHVKEVPNYTFPDLTLTLWYGACDTSIANLAKPVLTPTPAEITGPTREDGLRLAPGTYTITWTVKPDEDCDIYATYEQQLTVEFPKCGTLDEPYIVKDLEGNEYNTIRIGCECWLAENLRTSAPNASYYNDDDANENFGRLYNWNDAIGDNNAVMETKLGTTYIEGVCPVGWAIPTVAQYNTMMSNVEGVDAIKSDDQSTWLPGNAGTNAAGFAAMGAGYYEAMQYQRQLGYTYFWTADLNESNSAVAKVMELRCGCDELTCTEKSKEAKVSVRCVKVEPLNYAMINIAFDMHDDGTDYLSGWDGGYILVEYGSSQVLMTVSHEQNVCQLPVPKGSDVTLTWSSWVYDGEFDDQVSFTVTNEETGEVLATSENLQEGVIANFHVKGKSVPEDFQNVEFILNDSYGDQWNGGAMLQVNYGSGILNLTESDTEGYFDYHNLVALPVGSHIILNWVPGTWDEEISIRVKYEGSSDVLYEVTEPAAGQLFEFDVEKQ